MLKKIIYLLKKKGLAWCIYNGFAEKFNYKIPWIAGILISKTIDRIEKQDMQSINIPTLDGSCQVVHPDYIAWRKKKLLVCTPYPFGIDIYENPILYQYVGNRWIFYKKKNISMPDVNCHLSDPCFAVIQNKLYIYYRQTLKGRINKNWIYRIEINNDGEFGNKNLILESEIENFLSPIIIQDLDKLYMFYVDVKAKEKTELLCRESNNGIIWSLPKILKVGNLPYNTYIWHMTIGYSERLNKQKVNDFDTLYGIFTLYHTEKKQFINYYAKQEIKRNYWTILKPVKIPEALLDTQKNFYKSTVFSDDYECYIILSCQDKKGRWKLYCIELERFE